MTKINLNTFLLADYETKHNLLLNAELDERSRICLQWANAFKAAGATISDEQVLYVYHMK